MTKDLQLGNLNKDIFGNPFPKHEKVRNFTPTQEPAVNHMITTMLEASLCGMSSEFLCVLKREYKPYMEMNLGEVEKVTGSTRVHNMDAEEMVGLFSAAQDRAPSATMLYLISKIKATRNKTVDWIQDQPEDQQRRHISLAITVAPTIKAGSQRHGSEVHLEIVRRMKQKELKRHHIKRKPLETKLGALKSKTVAEISYALNCGEEKAKIIQDILKLRLKNRNILHAWLKDGDVRTTQPWNGRIIKKSGSVNHVVCYWSSDET